MKTKSFCLSVKTKEAPEFIDITDWVSGCVADSQVSNGFAVIFSKHTTAAVKINENEPLLLEDMAAFLEGVAPRHAPYRHNDFEIRTVNMNPDESPNGHAPPATPPAGHQRDRADSQRRDAVRHLSEHFLH